MAGQLTLEPLNPAKEMERFLSFVYRPGALIEIRTSMLNIKDKVQTVGGPCSDLSLAAKAARKMPCDVIPYVPWNPIRPDSRLVKRYASCLNLPQLGCHVDTLYDFCPALGSPGDHGFAVRSKPGPEAVPDRCGHG
jgi:hypothetical protein